MEINVCKFLKIGLHNPCENKPTKDSNYCSLHKYRFKKSHALPCLKCKKGTSAKYQVCVGCGAHSIRKKHEYWRLKSYNAECLRFRRIEV